MSPTIEIDEDVFSYLKSKAEPFVDTPNSVLRRELRIDVRSSEPAIASESPAPASTAKVNVNRPKTKPVKDKPKRTRAASGTLLPEERYERPLLKALADTPTGQAPYRDVVEAVGNELKDELMAADFENLTSGAVRWQSRLQFVRLRLIERGMLDKDAPRGVWGITDEGRAFLASREAS